MVEQIVRETTAAPSAMIKCRKPIYYEPDGAWEMDNGKVAKPVIVVLDPRRVFAKLETAFPNFVPHPARLELVMSIPKNGYLELPEVRGAFYEGVQFVQGRHRTAALAKLGFSAYPVVTSDAHADRILAKFGASVEEARSRFDWDSINYPVMAA